MILIYTGTPEPVSYRQQHTKHKYSSFRTYKVTAIKAFEECTLAAATG